MMVILKKKENEFNFEFDISDPVMLDVVVSNRYSLDFIELCRELNKWASVYYGFSYDVDIKYFPASFGIGDYEGILKLSNIGRSGKEDVRRWVNNSAKIGEGFFRGVFEENMITSAHLKGKINGITLKDLIEKGLGNLEDIADNLFYWKLSASQLNDARRLIYGSSFII